MNTNPFEPPSQTASTSEAPTMIWNVRQTLSAALLLTAFGPAIGLIIHFGFGIPLLETMVLIEGQVWLMLLLSISILFMWVSRLNRLLSQGSNIDGTIRCALGVSSSALLLLNIAHQAGYLFSQIPSERFVFFQRVFGDYAWYYWLMIGVLGVLPLTLLVPGIRRASSCAIPESLIVATASAFFLRVNYITFYGLDFPTSWQQFFWPF